MRKNMQKLYCQIITFLAMLVVLSCLGNSLVFEQELQHNRKENTAGSTIILTCSDIQDPDTSYLFAEGDYTRQQDILKEVMAQVKTAYPSVDAFFCGGDYNFSITKTGECCREDGVIKTYSEQEAAAVTAIDAGIVCDTVKECFPAVTNEQITLVQGNHDQFCGFFAPTGGYDKGAYSVYVINEEDYPASIIPSGAASASQYRLAKDLSAWLGSLAKIQYDRPVFVLSHVPLHFTNRTETNGSALYAQFLFNAIQRYADTLNIVFLYGHDHCHESDDYLGGSSVFLMRGDTLTIAKPGSRNVGQAHEKKLRFTYMNYGYMGYYWDDWDPHSGSVNEHTDHTLTMTTFEINGNEVAVCRWDAQGRHLLKSAGVASGAADARSDSLPPNCSVYESPQMIRTKDLQRLEE